MHRLMLVFLVGALVFESGCSFVTASIKTNYDTGEVRTRPLKRSRGQSNVFAKEPEVRIQGEMVSCAVPVVESPSGGTCLSEKEIIRKRSVGWLVTGLVLDAAGIGGWGYLASQGSCEPDGSGESECDASFTAGAIGAGVSAAGLIYGLVTGFQSGKKSWITVSGKVACGTASASPATGRSVRLYTPDGKVHRARKQTVTATSVQWCRWPRFSRTPRSRSPEA